MSVPSNPSRGAACNCNVGTTPFNLIFQDCELNTGEGFDDPVLGSDRRAVLCKVFQDLAQLLEPNTNPCGGATQQVNVEIIPSKLGNYRGRALPPLPVGIGGTGGAYYVDETTGLVDGMPWTILNSGRAPLGSEQICHGQIRINFDSPNFDWHLDPTSTAVPSDKHDLYTIALHEALHMLGIGSFLSYVVSPSGSGGYSRYDAFLRLGGNPVIVNNPNPSLNWMIGPNIGSNLYGACQTPPTSSGVSFSHATGGVPVYTGPALNSSSFSHLDADCDPDNPSSYVMTASLGKGIRRPLTDDEKQLLCALGYRLRGNAQCGCAVGGADDDRVPCNGALYEVPICSTLTIKASDLLLNDRNATAMQFLQVVDPGSGTLAPHPTIVGSYVFTPSRLGIANLVYVPTGCGGKTGNKTYVHIKVVQTNTCPTYCNAQYPGCGGIGNYTHCYEATDCGQINSCNLVCNPSICGTVYAYGPRDGGYSILDTRWQVNAPGWIRTHGTPDYHPNTPWIIPDNGGLAVGGGILDAVTMEKSSEGLMNFVPIDPNSAYLFSFKGKAALLPPDDPNGTAKVHIKLVDGNIVPIVRTLIPDFGTPSVPNALDIATETFVGGNFQRRGSCFSTPNDYRNALWLYYDKENGYGVCLFDKVELIKDNFTAGPDQTLVVCGDPVFLGQKYCMLSGVGIEYEWKEAGSNQTVARYRVMDGVLTVLSGNVDANTHQAIVSPHQTTTYVLRRDIYDLGGLPNTFALCSTTDEVLVTVNTGAPDPRFVVEVKPCNRVQFTPFTSPGDTHEWDFGDNVTSTDPEPLHLYPAPGLYTVSHRATNPCGASAAETMNVEVTTQLPDASFTFSVNCRTVSFTAAQNFPGSTHEWDFGDGNTGTGANPTHVYGVQVSGPQTVTHRLADVCGKITAIETVVIDCPVDFYCPCTAANTLNINATVEHRYSVLEGLYDYDKNNDGILDQSDHNGCIAIAGELLIDQDLGIADCRDIRMQPCSEIKVQGAAQQTVQGKHLSVHGNRIHGCQGMWKGLTALSSATIECWGNDIYDAQYAVTAYPSPFTHLLLLPTLADVHDNKFENCHVGFYVPGQFGGAFGGNLWQTPFVGNRFLTSAGLMANCVASGSLDGDYDPARGYAGVLVRGADFEVGGENECTFDNLRNGVVASNSSVLVRNCSFTDMVGGEGGDGDGVNAFGGAFTTVLNSRFLRCFTGIYGYANFSLGAAHNEMDTVVYGIVAEEPYALNLSEQNTGSGIRFWKRGIAVRDLRSVPWVSYYKISDNVLRTGADAGDFGMALRVANAVPVQLPNGSEIARNTFHLRHDLAGGAFLEKQRNWKLEANVFLAQLTNAPNGLSRWLLNLNNSSNNQLIENQALEFGGGRRMESFLTNAGTGNLFCCNTSDGGYVGYHFTGTCVGTRWRQSNMYNHDRGLWCGPATVISDQPANLDAPGQTGIQKTNSNRFLGNSGDGLHEGNQSDVTNSEIFVPTFVPPHFPPSGASPSSGWFRPSTQQFVPCESDEVCPQNSAAATAPEIVFNDTDYALSVLDFGGASFDDLFAWEGGRELYARIEANSSWQGLSPAIDAFHAGAALGPLAAFHAADEAVAFVEAVPETWSAAMQAAAAEIAAKDAEAETIRQSAVSQSTPEGKRAIYLQAAAKKGEANGQRAQIGQMLAQIDSLRQARAGAALSLVLQLPTGDVFQGNRKTALRVYLEVLANAQQTLTPAQLADIAPIAFQCPLTGGTGVYIARTLYERNIPHLFDDATLCQGIEERGALASAPLATGLQIVPNPVQGQAEMVVPGSQEGSLALLQLTDLSGRTVLGQTLRLSQNRTVFDVSSLPSGLYFCTVRANGTLYAPVKLAVAH